MTDKVLCKHPGCYKLGTHLVIDSSYISCATHRREEDKDRTVDMLGAIEPVIEYSATGFDKQPEQDCRDYC